MAAYFQVRDIRAISDSISPRKHLKGPIGVPRTSTAHARRDPGGHGFLVIRPLFKPAFILALHIKDWFNMISSN
jgi:hypothetical protein